MIETTEKQEAGMALDDGRARPGVAPGGRVGAGTLFAALYGELAAHPWRDPESEHDAYQLFHNRSVAMGWLEGDGVRGEGSGLWGMNDAGWSHAGAAPGARLIAWFQAGAAAVDDGRPLPVQPFLRCAGEVVTRAGVARLSTVQVLLPVDGIDPEARPPYAPVPATATADWFADADPAARTPVEVTVSGGRDPALPAAAARFAADLRERARPVFTLDAHEIGGGAVTPAPLFDDSFWNGPPVHGVTLRGTLAEWSCDAVGWLGATLADCAALADVRKPLLYTATRVARGA
jgi:hypothetical protein